MPLVALRMQRHSHGTPGQRVLACSLTLGSRRLSREKYSCAYCLWYCRLGSLKSSFCAHARSEASACKPWRDLAVPGAAQLVVLNALGAC
jgi:hypothetical protein